MYINDFARKTCQVFRQGTNGLQVIGSFEASQPDYSLSGARAGWLMGPPSTGSKAASTWPLADNVRFQDCA